MWPWPPAGGLRMVNTFVFEPNAPSIDIVSQLGEQLTRLLDADDDVCTLLADICLLSRPVWFGVVFEDDKDS